MSIATLCDKCKTPYRVPDAAIGKVVVCKKCRAKFKVAAPSPPRKRKTLSIVAAAGALVLLVGGATSFMLVHGKGKRAPAKAASKTRDQIVQELDRDLANIRLGLKPVSVPDLVQALRLEGGVGPSVVEAGLFVAGEAEVAIPVPPPILNQTVEIVSSDPEVAAAYQGSVARSVIFSLRVAWMAAAGIREVKLTVSYINGAQVVQRQDVSWKLEIKPSTYGMPSGSLTREQVARIYLDARTAAQRADEMSRRHDQLFGEADKTLVESGHKLLEALAKGSEGLKDLDKANADADAARKKAWDHKREALANQLMADSYKDLCRVLAGRIKTEQASADEEVATIAAVLFERLGKP